MTEPRAEARALLAEALGLPAEALADDAAMDNIESWDSLAHMRLVLAVEARLGAELPPEAILALSSLDDVAAALLARLSEASQSSRPAADGPATRP